MAETWNDKVGNIHQVGGIETAVLDNGPARGSRIAWVNTGSGLRYKIVIDRSLDLTEAFFNQHSLVWLSRRGPSAPDSYTNSGLEWLSNFTGGLVTTCGLSHIGGPESDGKESRGLHGRISNIPAEIESVIQPDPTCGRMEMSVTAVMRESKVFGPDLVLRRTITSRLGEPGITLHDEVTNGGNLPCPHMILYHCNFGWPLVDEGTQIVYKGTCRSRGMDFDNELFNAKHDYKKCLKPRESHRGTGESCGFVDVTPDAGGLCHIGLANERLGLAVKITYPKKQLPAMANWQHWGPGEYVCGLEPGTNPPIGQNAVRSQNELITLQPGEKRTYRLQMQVLTGTDQIQQFLAECQE